MHQAPRAWHSSSSPRPASKPAAAAASWARHTMRATAPALVLLALLLLPSAAPLPPQSSRLQAVTCSVTAVLGACLCCSTRACSCAAAAACGAHTVGSARSARVVDAGCAWRASRATTALRSPAHLQKVCCSAAEAGCTGKCCRCSHGAGARCPLPPLLCRCANVKRGLGQGRQHALHVRVTKGRT